MTNVDKILEERGNAYGDFGLGSELEANILNLMSDNCETQTGSPMDFRTLVWVSKIVMKLSRISVSPAHLDSWVDIEGYARLVVTQLNKEIDNDKSN
jgi:hypothetical protein